MDWIGGSRDLCCRDVQLCLVNDDRFLAVKSQGKVLIFNLKTGRRIEHDLPKDSGAVKAIWSDDDHLICFTEKKILQIDPMKGVTATTDHPKHFHCPPGSHEAKVMRDKHSGSIQRVYFVVGNFDSGLSVVSEFYGGKKTLKFGPVAFSHGFRGIEDRQVLFDCNRDLVVKVSKAVVGSSGREKLSFVTDEGYLFDSRDVIVSLPITCLAVHPEDPVVATGNKSGKIAVWRQSSGHQKFFATTFHWHSLPVRSLKFSGIYGSSHLYSGGHEGAIIKWDTKEATKLSIVPRIGSSIVAIQDSDSAVVIATAANTVKLFASTFNELSMIAGLGRLVLPEIYWHDESGTVALLNDDRHRIQMLDPLTKTEKLSFDIGPYNKILGDRDVDPQQADGRMNAFAVSGDGQWIASSENNWDSLGECCIKIWRLDLNTNSSNKIRLNTRISQPHSSPSKKMVFMDFATGLGLLSLGESAKLWLYDLEDDQWILSAIFSYRKLNPTCCNLSPDKSILALGFESCLTVWDANDYTLITSLSTGDDSAYASIIFGDGSLGRYLFGATKSRVLCWDLLSSSLVKSLGLEDTKFITMGCSRIGLVYSGGLITFDSSFKVKSLAKVENVVSAICDVKSQQIFILQKLKSGSNLGVLRLRDDVEKQEDSTNEYLHQNSIYENATNIKLSPIEDLTKTHSRISKVILDPEMVPLRISKISGSFVKRTLPD